MNSQLDLEALKGLINVIENSEKTSEVLSWMEKISDSSFGLIDSLILTFLDEMDKNLQESNAILRALTKLFEYIPEIILPQLKSNPKFPLALSKYLTTTKLQDLEGGGFVLLVEIFSSKGFKDVANDVFINSLLDSLVFIQDEKIFLSIVNILMSISNETIKLDDDLVLKLSFPHVNQRHFAEYIVHSVNKAEKEQMIKILDFLIRIFLFQRVKGISMTFFYNNDFKVLCDVVLRDMGNTSDEDVREKMLDLTAVIMKCEQYKGEKYRKKEILQLMEELEMADVSEKSKKCAGFIIKENLD